MRLIFLFLLCLVAVPAFAAQERIFPFACGLHGGMGLASDNQGGCLVSLGQQGKVVRVGPGGERSVLAGELNFPTGLALAPNGNAYCATVGDNSIWLLPAAGKMAGKERISHRRGAPIALHMDSEGGLLLPRSGAGTVERLGPAGQHGTLLSGLASPLAVVPWNGGLVVLCRKGLQHRPLLFYSPDEDSLLPVNAAPPLPGPGLDVYGEWLLVPDYDRGGVVAISEKGEVRRVARSIVRPLAVTVGKEGRLFVLSTENGVLYAVDAW